MRVRHQVSLAVLGAARPNPVIEVMALIAGRIAGADSIDDVDLLRHRAMGRISCAARAQSALGTFL